MLSVWNQQWNSSKGTFIIELKSAYNLKIDLQYGLIFWNISHYLRFPQNPVFFTDFSIIMFWHNQIRQFPTILVLRDVKSLDAYFDSDIIRKPVN